MSAAIVDAAVAIDAPALPAGMRFDVMQESDLGHVMAIEQDVHAHPWSLGNFTDSLASAYTASVLRDGAGRAIGYFLLLAAVDEADLLNVSLHRALHGQGLGRVLMDEAVRQMRAQRMQAMLLEVRPSNVRALHVYQRYGFVEVNRRKGYYPAAGQAREDAIVMRLPL